jgi:hypothetical protein
MPQIEIVSNPSEDKLREMGVFDWPIWEKEASTFPWSYDEREVCYLLEGEVEVTPDGGEPVTIKAGDLVVFPQGMSCTWSITQGVRKHYSFG